MKVKCQTTFLPNLDGPPLLFRAWRDSADQTVFQKNRTGQRNAVFLGHSQPTHSGMLSNLAQAFISEGWNCFSGDIRGHGHSASERHPIGHLEVETGWFQAVEDLRFFLEKSFNGIPWENRLVVVPNITALLTLEVLKTWPDLARHIVLISPPPNQKTTLSFAKAFAHARIKIKGELERDEHTLHHLYNFLGSHLKDRRHPADVMTSDRTIIHQMLADPLGWPIPTTAYWSNIFNGTQNSYRWQKNKKVKEGTRCLLMCGSEDAMVRNGGFLPSIQTFLSGIGLLDNTCIRIEGARTALFLEEERFGISKTILKWMNENWRPRQQLEPLDDITMVSNQLRSNGYDIDQAPLQPEQLVELCYHAIHDETYWNDLIHHMILHHARKDEGNQTAFSETVRASDEEDTDTMMLGKIQAHVQKLMPHWERAFELNQQVMLNATLGVILQSVIERLSIGIAVLDSDLKPLHVNDTFMEIFSDLTNPSALPKLKDEAQDCPETQSSPALHETPQFRKELSMLLSGLRRAEASGEGPHPNHNEDQILIFAQQPVGFLFYPQSLKQTSMLRGGPQSILILRNGTPPLENQNTTLGLLELAYGLTGKEAQVCLRIARGLGLEDIAEDLGISVSTIRSHLKSAFQKTGVHSQAELAAKLLSGPIGWL